MSDISKALNPQGSKQNSENAEAGSETDWKNVPKELEAIRLEIDRLDKAIASLLHERLRLVKRVVQIKEANELPTLDAEREKAVIENVRAAAEDPEAAALLEELYSKLFELTRRYQAGLRAKVNRSG
jgi:monofunctional chorismate mutase